ncbi:nucleotidyltransferase [Proteinivorax hydrogeniformans]|uniref:tRNA(Met) cytidine acetate ligase n=1 Tax=Proteinivorax hydrogeniformans TaxID=1826727 RepID=A0AAU8HPY5_9FIRM
MNTVGIVVEYNPFHNGHYYHIAESKKKAEAEFVVGIISGNYVQRGEPAIINKWARTKIALMHGVDMVIELPTIYSTQSAEGFARGAISTLAYSGIVDKVVFGSEAGEVFPLEKVADRLLNIENSPKSITSKLKEGKSYSQSLQQMVGDTAYLTGSNNILGIEYIKQNIKLGSPIQMQTIKRTSSNYNEENPSDDYFASATSLRPMIKNSSPKLKQYMPPKALSILKYALNEQQFIDLNSFTGHLFPLLLRDGQSILPSVQGYEQGLENRLLSILQDECPINLEGLVSKARSKRYSKSRIKRLLLHFMLGINSEAVKEANKRPTYIRILGCTEKGLTLLGHLKKRSELPFSLNYNNLLESLPTESIGYNNLVKENIFSNIYINKSFYQKKYNLDYRKKPIIIKGQS